MINKSKFKEPMPTLGAEKRIFNFEEVETGFTDDSALREALRCLNCKNKPCVSGCPVGIDIPKFIFEITQNNLEDSYKTIVKSNSFPAICGRVCPQEKQCEKQCVRAKTGDPVAIGRLERYVADKNSSCENSQKENSQKFKTFAHNVAVIGSGPSGITCASELLKKGFGVTVFEALHKAGGVLSYGIPEFRLPRKVLEHEIEKLKNDGAKIVTNAVVGKSFSVDDLFKKGFDAVYISSGAGLPGFMNIPGEGLSGVCSANEFLTRINLMKAYKKEYDTPIVYPSNVVVVGGGNVAMDAARCARRLGTPKVTVIYRRTENEMPARKDEINHAKEEGVEFLTLSNPTEFLGENGKVTAVRCVRMALAEPDESGRRSVKEQSDENFEIKADAVIVAIGNRPNALIKDSDCSVEFDSKGRIIADPETTKTSRKYVYAGGDAVTGAATVILAMGAGKKAAVQIAKDFS